MDAAISLVKEITSTAGRMICGASLNEKRTRRGALSSSRPAAGLSSYAFPAIFSARSPITGTLNFSPW